MTLLSELLATRREGWRFFRITWQPSDTKSSQTDVLAFGPDSQSLGFWLANKNILMEEITYEQYAAEERDLGSGRLSASAREMFRKLWEEA